MIHKNQKKYDQKSCAGSCNSDPTIKIYDYHYKNETLATITHELAHALFYTLNNFKTATPYPTDASNNAKYIRSDFYQAKKKVSELMLNTCYQLFKKNNCSKPPYKNLNKCSFKKHHKQLQEVFVTIKKYLDKYQSKKDKSFLPISQAILDSFTQYPKHEWDNELGVKLAELSAKSNLNKQAKSLLEPLLNYMNNNIHPIIESKIKNHHARVIAINALNSNIELLKTKTFLAKAYEALREAILKSLVLKLSTLVGLWFMFIHCSILLLINKLDLIHLAFSIYFTLMIKIIIDIINKRASNK